MGRDSFRQLHSSGTFVMPNAWDVGSARLLQWRGFSAIATTSSGFAATLGRLDQHVSLDELLIHVEALAAGVDVPLSVDSERCFADDPAGVSNTVGRLRDAGAAGCSIEDYDPAKGEIEPIEVAAERVAAAAGHGPVLTARAENHLYGRTDLDDTIERLMAYRDAGADVVYAPGLVDLAEIRQVVASVDAPVNVLARRNGPSVPELADAGVRRVSTGGALAWAAYGELVRAADELRTEGTFTYADRALSAHDLAAALAPRR